MCGIIQRIIQMVLDKNNLENTNVFEYIVNEGKEGDEFYCKYKTGYKTLKILKD